MKEADYKKQYDEYMTQIAQEKEKISRAEYNINNIINMILVPFYHAQYEMEWQVYGKDSPEFQQNVPILTQHAKYACENYVSGRTALEVRRPTHNPEDEAWTELERDMADIAQHYQDIPKNLDGQIDDSINAQLRLEILYKEFNDFIANNKPEEEKPVINTAEKIQQIEQQTDTKVEALTSTPEPEGHIYPVALVESWTKEMSEYNNSLKDFIGSLDQINFDKVDRMWLKNQVLKFVAWLKKQLKKLKDKIVKGLKGMMSSINKVMGLISPILSLPTDPLAILGWAGNVVSFFTEPYTKVLKFIADFSTYTPPLVSEATTLATTVAGMPSTINNKVNQLTGEGSELIREEIENAVAGLVFEAPSIGDLT